MGAPGGPGPGPFHSTGLKLDPRYTEDYFSILSPPRLVLLALLSKHIQKSLVCATTAPHLGHWRRPLAGLPDFPLPPNLVSVQQSIGSLTVVQTDHGHFLTPNPALGRTSLTVKIEVSTITCHCHPIVCPARPASLLLLKHTSMSPPQGLYTEVTSTGSGLPPDVCLSLPPLL